MTRYCNSELNLFAATDGQPLIPLRYDSRDVLFGLDET